MFGSGSQREQIQGPAVKSRPPAILENSLHAMSFPAGCRSTKKEGISPTSALDNSSMSAVFSPGFVSGCAEKKTTPNGPLSPERAPDWLYTFQPPGRAIVNCSFRSSNGTRSSAASANGIVALRTITIALALHLMALAARPFDLELDRRILHFHFVELNDRLNVRVVWNVSHDGIGVRPKCLLKCVHRVENQVRHGNERGL